MKPESSLPHSQVPATCPFPEPARSSPCPHIPFPEDPSYYYATIIQQSKLMLSSHLRLGPPSDLSLSLRFPHQNPEVELTIEKSNITRHWSNRSRIDSSKWMNSLLRDPNPYSLSNKEELPEEWKEFIIVPIYKKGDKTDCSNYRGISLLPTTYKILSNILLSRLTPHAEENYWGSSMWILTQQVNKTFYIKKFFDS